jgi:hypothetical protein
MGIHSVTATFNAVDNISNITQHIGQSLLNMGQNAIDTMRNIDDGLSLTQVAFTGLAALGVGALVAAIDIGVSHMEEMNASMAGISARTGVAGEDLNKFRDAAKDIMSSGVVANFDTAAKMVERIKTDIGGLDDPKELKSFAIAVAGVAKAWTTTEEKVLGGVDNMVSKFSGLNGDPKRALDILVRTAQESHEPLDKINQIVEQFGGKFASAGISAVGMGGLIALGANAGITNFGALAKTIDTFHEGIVKPRPGFDATMKKLGLADMLKEARANKVPMETVLDAVYGKFALMPEGPDKAQAALALFGKGVEQIGGAETLGKLDNFGLALSGPNGIAGAAEKAAKAVQEDGTLGTALKTLGGKAKEWIGDKFEEAYNRIKSIDWQKIGESVVGLIEYFVPKWEEWFGSTGKLHGMIQTSVNNIVITANVVAGKVTAAFKSIGDGIMDGLRGAAEFIQGLVDKINAILGFGGSAGDNKTYWPGGIKPPGQTRRAVC